MATKIRSCSLCNNECHKRDIVCAKCWAGLAQARKNAISLAPYSRGEKNRKFITDLLSCDIKILNQMIAEHKIKPESFKEQKNEQFLEMEAVFTEINAGKSNETK